MSNTKYVSAHDLAVNEVAAELYIAARKNEAEMLKASLGKKMVVAFGAVEAEIHESGWKLCSSPSQIEIRSPAATTNQAFPMKNLNCAIAFILAKFH